MEEKSSTTLFSFDLLQLVCVCVALCERVWMEEINVASELNLSYTGCLQYLVAVLATGNIWTNFERFQLDRNWTDQMVLLRKSIFLRDL